jgi:hypothetical protein
MMTDEFPTHRLPDDPDPRPFSVRVLSIVGGALGLTGLFIIPLLLMPLDVPSWFDHIWVRPAYRLDPVEVWLLASTIGGMALSGLLLAASIGCLYLRGWGRVLMIGYCVVSLLFSIAWLVAQIRTWPVSLRMGGELRGVATWFALCCWIAATVYAAVTLYCMTRPSVRAAFRGESVYPNIPEYEE